MGGKRFLKKRRVSVLLTALNFARIDVFLSLNVEKRIEEKFLKTILIQNIKIVKFFIDQKSHIFLNIF
jgi:hypothetical protein